MSFRKKFIGTRAFYASVLALLVPMIVQQGITQFVNLLDNVMVGRLGTAPMSGVAIVNQIIFIFNLTIFGGLGGRLPLRRPVCRQKGPGGGALHPAVPAGVQRGGMRPGNSGLSAVWGAAVSAVLKQRGLLSPGDRRHPGTRQGVHRHHAVWAFALRHQPVLFQHPCGTWAKPFPPWWPASSPSAST